MDELVLPNAEFRLCCIVWNNEPLKSPRLAELAAKELGWKKTTTYTVLRKLIDRGVLQNQDTIVSSVIKREHVQKKQGENLLNRVFEGNLPSMFVSFLDGYKLKEGEAELLHQLIEKSR